MTARPFALLAGALTATFALPLKAQTGTRYTVSISDGRSHPSHAVVTTLGDRSRIQIQRDHDDDRMGDSYIILRDGKLYSIDSTKREINTTTQAEFEQIVGTALRAVSPMVTMHVDDTSISAEEVRDDDRVLGYATRHFRMTQRFTLRVTAFGMGGDDNASPSEVITDFWVTPDAKLPRNPLIELMISAPSAPAQQSKSFSRESARVRDSLFTGMPLRVVVRARDKDDHDLVEKARAEVTKLERVPVDTGLFVLPAGYTRNTGRGMRFSF